MLNFSKSIQMNRWTYSHPLLSHIKLHLAVQEHKELTLSFISVSAGNGRRGRDRGVSGTDRWLSEWLDLYFHALYFYLNFVCMTCISSVSFCCHLKGKQKNHLDQIDNLSGLLCLKELGGTTIKNVFLAISYVHYPLSVNSLSHPCLHTLFFF